MILSPLGCNYELQRRQNFDLESALHRNGDIGMYLYIGVSM